MTAACVQPRELLPRLRAAGLLGPDDEVRLTPLPGGVSSDIQLVTAGARRFVIKTALPKLKVKDDWFADVSRNAVEQEYFRYAAAIVPGVVARILGGSTAEGWFAMEYLGDGFVTWKERLMAGDARRPDARQAGEVLGRLHGASWGELTARKRFATLPNFHALRIEPYLLTTAERLPAARAALAAEARRLAATELALVHGDYSPKNILLGTDRFVVLDAECGWFGDPAFDTGFLLTHLFLKALMHAPAAGSFLPLIPEFWGAYCEALGARADAALETRTTRLVIFLLLARVHGKSPVEYLTTPAQRDLVTNFGLQQLTAPAQALAALTAAWHAALIRA